MITRNRATLILVLTVVLLILPMAAGARPSAPQAQAAPVTTITVDSGTDPDNSMSKKCSTETVCTLRRAIVEARWLAPAQRPVLIDFDIPATAVEGYDSALGVWIIEPAAAPADLSVFRTVEGGQTTIDGSTQPGGRGSGPKIILRGPGNKKGLIIGTNSAGGHDENVVRGIAFQNFNYHLTLNSNDNMVTENWFGLTVDGTAPYLRNDDPQDGSGVGGVWFSANVAGNEVKNNVFLGFDGTAGSIRGDDNIFSKNYVGTNAAGNTPGKQTGPNLICTPVDWLGGGGLWMEGEGHLIEENMFAGLRQQIFGGSTQPDAIHVTGKEHIIRNNRIGLNKAAQGVGVCGRGINLADGPKQVVVKENTIVNPGMSGISLNGILYDANELRGNVIRQNGAWPEVEGNPEPENAIQLGALLYPALKNFQPAAVTSINGKKVTGTHGAGSPCPNCTIELFIDDNDGIVEALQSLAVVTADGSGDWQAMIPKELKDGEGIRTTSTSRQYNTIPGRSANTTTGLSLLHIEGEAVFLPISISNR